MSPESSTHLLLPHPRVQRVDKQIFLRPFAPDCMRHECRCDDEEGRVRLDACCQHGCDVDLFEKEAILRRREEVASVLAPAWQDPASWFFDDEAEDDPEAPSGRVTRTGRATRDEAGGCVFLQHDGRGCALHRAALEHGFAPSELKPVVCRLYPLSYGDGELGFSDDYARYSCATTDGPTVYRLMRPVLAEVFGLDVVRLLDKAERQVARRRLAVVAYR